MATREYGFMGEPFPSKKFQRAMAEYLGHIDPDPEEPKEVKYTPGENPLFDYYYNEVTLSEYQAQATIDLYKMQVEAFKWKLEHEALDFNRLGNVFNPPYTPPDIAPPDIVPHTNHVTGDPHA